MDELAPSHLLVGISGFGETERHPSGIEEILWRVFSDLEGVIAARFTWRDSLVTMVRWIERITAKWPSIQVSVLGYSYGGTTAVRLVEALRSTPITNLFLIDPVWRPWNHLPSFVSIGGVGTLWVESSVAHVFVWRQTKTWIRGCQVVCKSEKTKLYEDTLNYTHRQIDNSQLVRGCILERLRQCHETE